MAYITSVPTTLGAQIQDSFEEYGDMAASRGYVGLGLLPVIEVRHSAGQMGLEPVEQLKRSLTAAELKRAESAAYLRVQPKFETLTWTTDEYGLEVPVDDRESALYRDFVDAAVYAAKVKRYALMDAMEKNIIDICTSATTYTGASLTTAIGTAWTTAASATPVANIFGAMKKVFDGTGVQANAICMSWKDAWHMKQTAEFQDFFKHTMASAPPYFTNEDLARAFGVDKFLVAGAARNSAAEGAAASMGTVWPTGKVWVGVACSDNASPKETCVGRTFHWAADGSNILGTVEEYEESRVRGRVYRIRHDYQAKLLYTPCAHILTGASS